MTIGLQSALHSGKGEEGQGRATNTIGYSSPNWSGFGLLATYTVDREDSVDGEDDNPWSVGASYSGLGGLYAFVSYVTTDANGDDDATQIGAQYTIDAFEVHGIYEIDGGLITLRQYGLQDGTNQNAGAGDGADIWSVGGTWTIGNNVIGADYGQGDEVDGPQNLTLDDDYTVWRLAAYHKFSDRTRVYVGYADLDPDDGNQQKLFSVGARHNF